MEARARQGRSNWIAQRSVGAATGAGLPADQLPLEPDQLAQLVVLVESGDLTGRGGKELLAADRTGRKCPERCGAAKFDLSGRCRRDRTAAMETLAANPAAVADYQSGKKAAIGRLIGETIRATGGEAVPIPCERRWKSCYQNSPVLFRAEWTDRCGIRRRRNGEKTCP